MASDFGKEYIQTLTNYEEYVKVLGNLERVFRVNRLKISVEEFERISNINAKKTNFDFVFSTPTYYTIGNTFEFFMGYIHTQTLSSILPPLALNPKKHSRVLDVAASPGGKTTEIADIMKNTGVIVANDIKRTRLSSLVGNINRLGVLNTSVTNIDGRNLPWKNYFDYVLVDAPCSNLGSSIRAIESVTKKRIRDIARVQRKILLSSFDSLKEGGELVYSTCTITEEENEAVVENLLNERQNSKLESINIDIEHEGGLKEYGKEFSKVMRIYPKHLKSEGFFIAKIKKE